MKPEEYIYMIEQDLAPTNVGSSYISEFAIKIFYFFESHDPSQHQHLTFRSFRDYLNFENKDSPYLASALSYLCNGVPLLEMKFEFFDDDLDEFFEVTNHDIQDASKHGSLIHPQTGHAISDYTEKVFVYYEPKDLATQLYTNASS